MSICQKFAFVFTTSFGMLFNTAFASQCDYTKAPPGVWKLQVCKDGNKVTGKTHYGPNYVRLWTINYHDNGKIKEERKNDAKGKLIVAKKYNKLGKLIKLRNEKNGKMHGKQISTWTGDRLRPALTYDTYSEGKRHGVTKRYHSNGNLAEVSTWKKGEEHGESKEYKEDKKPYRVITYNMGQKEGAYKSYDSDGKIRNTTYYKDNKRHGLDTDYHNSGKIKAQTCYQQGKRVKGLAACTGKASKGSEVVKTFHKNGKIDTIYKVANGEYHGKYRTYFDNGVLRSLITYKNGKKDGKWQTQSDKKENKIVKNYKDDKLHGLETHYYNNKKVKMKISWKDAAKKTETEYYMNGKKKNEMIFGDLVRITRFYDSGKISEKGTYKSSMYYRRVQYTRHGAVQRYSQNGKLDFEGNYVDGKPDGKQTEYYQNGKVYRAEVYKNNVLLSKKEYDGDGKLTLAEEYYEDGSKKSNNSH